MDVVKNIRVRGSSHGLSNIVSIISASEIACGSMAAAATTEAKSNDWNFMVSRNEGRIENGSQKSSTTRRG
jgi:hypothetical protein